MSDWQSEWVEYILAIVRAELGTIERPVNSNKVKYNEAYYGRSVSGAAYPWCCAFVWWVFQVAGIPELFYGGKKTAHCPTLMNFHKKQFVKDYRPGDVIFFNFSGGKKAEHVGICENWDGKRITTIDGNTGAGNEANGGAVMRRTRDKKYIVGAYRPAYETLKARPNKAPEYKWYTISVPLLKRGDSGAPVKVLQDLLILHECAPGEVDGEFGAKTGAALKQFQHDHSLKEDELCGPQVWQTLIAEKETP